MMLRDIERYHRMSNGFAEVAFMQPAAVAQLHQILLTDATRCLPPELGEQVGISVMEVNDFRIALTAHLDQVDTTLMMPSKGRVLRFWALAFSFLTVALLVVLGLISIYGENFRGILIATELVAVGAAANWIAFFVVLNQYRTARVAQIASEMRQELKSAISHSFARPVNDLAAANLRTG
jgi:hypothetical protein